MFLQVLSAAVSSLSGPCSAAGSRDLYRAVVVVVVMVRPTCARALGVLGDAVASPPMPPRVTVVVAPGSERRAVSGLEPEGRHAPFVPGASRRPDA